MNFSATLNASNNAQRDRLIAAEVAAYDWLDLVASRMEFGGWPEAAAARVIELQDAGQHIRVKLLVEFVELCPQGCNAYPKRHAHALLASLCIDRLTGNFQVEAAAGGD